MITGQVGIITKNPTWYGRAVQFFTHSPAYHTVYAISETEVVSAETPQVRIRPADYFEDILWTDEQIEPSNLRDAVRFARAQVGKPYAYLDILFLLIASITKTRTPPWIIDRLISTNQWFCSELCDAALNAALINLFPGRPACAVTPADFYNYMQERITQTPR